MQARAILAEGMRPHALFAVCKSKSKERPSKLCGLLDGRVVMNKFWAVVAFVRNHPWVVGLVVAGITLGAILAGSYR